MIGVEADIIEVVVFASGTDAFLRVCGSEVRTCERASPFRNVRRFLAEKKWDELIHAGIREKEIRRIRHEARGGNDGVLLRAEEIKERLADLSGCHKK